MAQGALRGSGFARIAAAVAGALWLSSSLPVHTARADAPVSGVAVSDGARVIVKYASRSPLLRRARPTERPDVDTDSAPQLGRRTGLNLRAGRHVAERLQVVMSDGMSSTELARRLGRERDVEYAVVDQQRRISAPPNDPFYAAGPPLIGFSGGPLVGQWYLRAPGGAAQSSIDIEAAWAITEGSSSVVVAVIDSGVRFDHPDLRRVASGGNLLDGYDFVSVPFMSADGDGRDADASDPGDYVTPADVSSPGNNGMCSPDDVGPSSWHGTQTAGLVGATTRNGVGMAGASPRVRVLPVRVLGRCGGYDSDIAAGTLWSAGIAVPGVPANPTPAKVLNLSLGGDGPCNAVYQDVVNQVNARGAVIVASAGNTTGHAVSAPANCTGVIGVAGLRHAGTKVGFSDLGPEIAISAPAGNCVNIGPGDACVYAMLTTTNASDTTPLSDAAGGSTYTDSFRYSLGTSFASPLVSATVALMFSVKPLLTPADVRASLQATARPFPTTGGDNGDGTLVTQCLAPRLPNQSQFDQLQCYCTQTTCGAGMLDAGAALRATDPIVVSLQPDRAPPQLRGTTITLTATGSGGPGVYEFRWWESPDGGVSWTVLRDWGSGTFVWTPTVANPAARVAVWVRRTGATAITYESYAVLPYPIQAPPPAVITSLVASPPSPQLRGTPIALTTTASGGSGSGAFEFKWWESPDGGAHWTVVRDWGSGTFVWTPTTASAAWRVAVWVRSAGVTADTYESYQVLPYVIHAPPPAAITSLAASLPSPQLRGTPITLTATGSGGSGSGGYEFKWWASQDGGTTWTVLRDWGSGTFEWTPTAANATGKIAVWVRSAGATADTYESYQVLPYVINAPPPAAIASLSASLPSPQVRGTPITLTATASGGTGGYEFKWWASTDGGIHWTVMRDWGSGTFAWTPTTASATGKIAVWVRSGGATADTYESYAVLPYAINAPPPAVVASLVASLPAPQLTGTTITLTATASGGSGGYEFKWWASTDGGTTWAVLRDWGSGTFAWTPTTASATGRVAVWVRSGGATADTYESYQALPYAIQAPPPATVTSLVASLPPPQLPGTPITLTATASGASGVYEFKWWTSTDGGAHWAVLRDWGSPTAVWTPTTAARDTRVAVWVRSLGATLDQPEAYQVLVYRIRPRVPLALDDFDGDGRSDFFAWLANGDVTVALLNGAQVRAFGVASSVEHGLWGGVPAQDIDGNGTADVFWHNADSHLVYVWLMAGTTIARVELLGAAPVGLFLIASGDFDGTGTPDLLWLDRTTGNVSVWLLNGLTVSAAGVVAAIPPGSVPEGCIADFDDDGKEDVLYSNLAPSPMRLYLMDGSSVRTSLDLPASPAGYAFVGCGDFSGDRRADVFWGSMAGGSGLFWLLDGGNVASTPTLLLGGSFRYVLSSGGSFGDHDGDGRLDLLWFDEAAGNAGVTLLQGTTVRSHTPFHP